MRTVASLSRVFAGGLTTLEPEGQRTGIYKRPIVARVRITPLGIIGDEHGDPRVHGGSEKAVHQYAFENYLTLKQVFPQSERNFVAGSLGENFSASGMRESTVNIGDVYRVGTAILQVSQPRSPCWKINHRFGIERLSLFVATERITGWYYRVISGGEIEPGDDITLEERTTERFSIDEFWRVQMDHRPNVEDLVELAATPGLAPEWSQRIAKRAAWLHAHVASTG